MSEHMDVGVRAGPFLLRSAGNRDSFTVSASVRRNGLWLLSAETESGSRAQRVKALLPISDFATSPSMDSASSPRTETQPSASRNRGSIHALNASVIALINTINAPTTNTTPSTSV